MVINLIQFLSLYATPESGDVTLLLGAPLKAHTCLFFSFHNCINISCPTFAPLSLPCFLLSLCPPNKSPNCLSMRFWEEMYMSHLHVYVAVLISVPKFSSPKF